MLKHALDSPLLPTDPSTREQFIRFLDSQAGVSTAHYDAFLEEVDQFGKRNREFGMRSGERDGTDAKRAKGDQGR